MTDHEINIAIAEACGWKHDTLGKWKKGAMIAPDGMPDFPPNYCTDLNAMHEAEKTLTDDELSRFHGLLDSVMDKAPRRNKNISWHAHRETAAAPQRAEAFLRTIEKWKD